MAASSMELMNRVSVLPLTVKRVCPSGTTNPEGCSIYRCDFVNGSLTYGVDEPRCQHPNGTCLKENYEERDTTSCSLTTCAKKMEMDGSFTMKMQIKPYGCQHPNGTCLEENFLDWDVTSCNLTTCKKEMEVNGSFRMRLEVRTHGCMLPSGVCLGPNRAVVDFDYCFKPLCRKLSDRSFTIKYNYFGCPVNGSCILKENTVRGEGCVNYRCKITNGRSKMQLKPLDCDLGDGTCLRNGNAIKDEVSCLQKECKIFKYPNGTFSTRMVDTYYGCPLQWAV
ncbi:uncharacterized protein LOC117337996 [Pecten maximus]|uniref:uncharacterized protein LOC117337996 n=1 Tax=Pecten maximus TaxID=6579 RepID=UPI0014581E0B|nr:uncharacterized protein LOC117337996 [Pecten maximus]